MSAFLATKYMENWLVGSEIIAIVLLSLVSLYFYYQSKDSKENLRLTLQATSDIIFLFDNNLRYVEVYASNENILLKTKEELIGKHIEDVLGPELGPKFSALLITAFETGKRQSIDYELALEETKYFEASIERRDSRVAVIMVRDNTQMKLLQKQLEIEKVKQFESARLASLGEVAGGIAHEINTPLAVISIDSEQMQEYLKQDPLPLESLNNLASRIEQTTTRIASIIKGLRSLSREASKDSKEKVSVESIVNSALTLVSEKIQGKEIDLKIDIEKDLSITCRQVQISQVILNLVNNSFYAVKNSGKPEQWIQVTGKRNGNFIEISVMDSGSGIPEEIRKKIFQPFFTTKPIGEGTGLGLSISSSIVADNGGELTLDQSSANTKFVIKFAV